MQRKPEDLTLADLPNADATRFEEWRRLHSRAKMAPMLGLIIWASVFITVPKIGGALGWGLPIILWFVYMIIYAIPLSSKERRLAAELGVPTALGLTPDQVARADRRIKTAKMVGFSLLGLMAVWAVLVVASIRNDTARRERGESSALSAAQQLAEPYEARLKDKAEVFRGAKVKPSFFQTAGVHPMAGVFFGESDHQANAPAVVVLSYDFFQRVFDSDIGILGRTIDFDSGAATITAIAPPGFSVPARTDFWTPARKLE